MNILQVTPGAGGMYCGNCLRDNSIVAAMRAMGHQVLMVPLYLPLTLDEPDQSAGTPIFFGGINVYLDQKFPVFRHAPGFVHRAFSWRPLLRWAGARAANTRASELADLVAWLKTQPRPDVVCLSNVLLIGMARQIKRELGAPLVCLLQGEDSFLDALPEPYQAESWRIISERAAEVDAFITPSHYFAELMGARLSLTPGRISVVHNGINLEGYETGSSKPPADPRAGVVLGYFARMSIEKGLDTLVEAFIRLRQRGRIPGLKLRVGGSCGPTDEVVVAKMKQRLASCELLDQVEFCPNLPRSEKISFLKSLSVFSVPARYGEAFGLYVVEALAAGVPVVQPRTAAFTWLVETSGAGVFSAPQTPGALAGAIEQVLLDPERARALGENGRRAAREQFSAEVMAQKTIRVFEAIIGAFKR